MCAPSGSRQLAGRRLPACLTRTCDARALPSLDIARARNRASTSARASLKPRARTRRRDRAVRTSTLDDARHGAQAQGAERVGGEATRSPALGRGDGEQRPDARAKESHPTRRRGEEATEGARARGRRRERRRRGEDDAGEDEAARKDDARATAAGEDEDGGRGRRCVPRDAAAAREILREMVRARDARDATATATTDATATTTDDDDDRDLIARRA